MKSVVKRNTEEKDTKTKPSAKNIRRGKVQKQKTEPKIKNDKQKKRKKTLKNKPDKRNKVKRKNRGNKSARSKKGQKKTKKNKGRKKTRKRKIKKYRRKSKGQRRNKGTRRTGKKKKKTNDASSVRQSTCSEFTCLTALVSVLKIEKDLVRNFLAQEKRVDTKVALMGENFCFIKKHYYLLFSEQAAQERHPCGNRSVSGEETW